MKKQILLISALALSIFGAFAQTQTAYDALIASDNELNGTALVRTICELSEHSNMFFFLFSAFTKVVLTVLPPPDGAYTNAFITYSPF